MCPFQVSEAPPAHRKRRLHSSAKNHPPQNLGDLIPTAKTEPSRMHVCGCSSIRSIFGLQA